MISIMEPNIELKLKFSSFKQVAAVLLSICICGVLTFLTLRPTPWASESDTAANSTPLEVFIIYIFIFCQIPMDSSRFSDLTNFLFLFQVTIFKMKAFLLVALATLATSVQF